jgi:hypothetical protein
MNKLALSYKSCKSVFLRVLFRLMTDSFPVHSAELEITVPLLIQIDKLVQLLESPVFTGKFDCSFSMVDSC